MDQTTPHHSLEERLKPWLDQAEWLLVLVIGLMLWIAGFVDLFTHTSEPATILGLYSIPFALFLVVYAAGFWLWIRLIFYRDGITLMKRGIHTLQTRAWLGLGLLAIFAALIASMFLLPGRWVRFPLLEIALLVIVLMATLLILFSRPQPGAAVALWRRIAMGLFLVLVAVEVVFQLLALAGWLPFSNTGGLFVPNGRVYVAGVGGGRTNRAGWYFPEFRLEEGTTRVVLTGGAQVQGLAVRPEENMGAVLDWLLNAEGESTYEALSLGIPDYGPTIYLSEVLYPFMIGPAEPQEVIVLFHLANDFQTKSAPDGRIPFAYIDENGYPNVVAEDQGRRHDLWHVTIRGYDPINPVGVVQSYLFTPALFSGLAERLAGTEGYVPDGVANLDGAGPDAPFGTAGFLFATEEDPRFEEAVELATRQLQTLRDYLILEEEVTLRIMTIPYFPAEFYERYNGESWESDLGGYDLLKPERVLAAYAAENDLSFLATGEAMRAAGLSPVEIQALFFDSGTGQLTPAGHAFFAQVIYDCFYDGAWAGPEMICPADK